MAEQEKRDHTMTLERALKIARMPRQWFNTQMKADLRDAAIEFIREHEALQTVALGKVNDRDVFNAEQTEKKNFNRVKEVNAKLREEIEMVEAEGKYHHIDRGLIDLIASYPNIVYLSALASDIRIGAQVNIETPHYNCANQLARDAYSREGGTRLDDYEKFLNQIINHLRRDKKDKDISLEVAALDEKTKADALARFEGLLQKVMELNKGSKHIEEIREWAKEDSLTDLRKKSQIHEKSIEAVASELGLNMEDPDVKFIVQRIAEEARHAERTYGDEVNNKKKNNYISPEKKSSAVDQIDEKKELEER